ncbi:MAG: DUF1640 domain-containing protein [Candidatus Marinimicrobia bacterium]|nr:DUF1640 domain-containing protein [Candidatus Neomarinimicrobiota bacterium]
MPVVTVKKPLREKLGDDGIEALVELINEAQKETKNNVIQFVEEKFEKRLSEELAKVRVEIAEVKTELIERIEALKTNDEKVKSELIKWMFIFWVGQIGAILGILFAFFKG